MPREPQSKRRKVSDESRSLPKIISRIYDMLQVEPEADLTGLDEVLRCVFLRYGRYGYMLLTALETAFLNSMSLNSVT